VKPKYLGKQNSLSKNSTLDRIARNESRKGSNKFEFNGLDIWNAYEFSYLLNGKPKIIVLEISIPSSSRYTIESKSMKLYLNSFFNKDYANQAEVINIITKRISNKCNSDVKIISKSSFKTFDKSNFTNKSGLLVYKGFRSICPVTSQPDWGNIYIYSSTHTLSKKEIFDFLFSLRNHGGFHESCVEKIFLYIKENFLVDHLEVCGRFLRRGGIDINPIRSSQKKLFFKNFREFNQ
jgi:7-cyano-7-deazaguanine reductase